MEFTIYRSKWRCGGDFGEENLKGLGQTMLLNDDGYMCCLGQIGLQIGYTESQIVCKAEPSEIRWTDSNILLDEVGLQTKLTTDAIDINDNPSTTIREKEKLLKERFQAEGIKLKFIGKSVKYKKE